MTLDELAAKANAAYRGGRIEAGRYWLQAKAQLGKGFRKWALKKAECSIQEVHRCMELAEAEQQEWEKTEPEVGIGSSPVDDDNIPTPSAGEAEPSASQEPSSNVVSLPQRPEKSYDDYAAEANPVWEAFLKLSTPAKEIILYRLRTLDQPQESNSE